MSYCRWSSDNFRCDIYAYESVMGGWAIHVAGQRYAGDIPELPAVMSVSSEEWFEARRKQSAFLDATALEPINLPHAGETFNEPTLEAFEVRLLALRELGYRIPDYVFEAITQEKEEEPTS